MDLTRTSPARENPPARRCPGWRLSAPGGCSEPILTKSEPLPQRPRWDVFEDLVEEPESLLLYLVVDGLQLVLRPRQERTAPAHDCRGGSACATGAKDQPTRARHGREQAQIWRGWSSGGAPDRIRTCDRRIRRPLLCPAELRGRRVGTYIERHVDSPRVFPQLRCLLRPAVSIPDWPRLA